MIGVADSSEQLLQAPIDVEKIAAELQNARAHAKNCWA